MSTGEKVSEYKPITDIDDLENRLSLWCQLNKAHGLVTLVSVHPMLTAARDAVRELQRLRSSSDDAKGRWVPWKPGDALPATAPVLHWTTWFDKEYTDAPMMRANYTHDFERWGVTAYWSIPLPPPYSAMSQETP